MSVRGSLTRLLRADQGRRSRFHTLRGDLCLRPDDVGLALLTALRRHLTGQLEEIPWFSRPAVRFLERNFRGGPVFEYSSGMSTLWFGRRSSCVVAIEHDETWFARVRSLTRGMEHVRLELVTGQQDYVDAIRSHSEKYFEIVSIDGAYRAACLEVAPRYVRDGGVLVVDNTDDPRYRSLRETLIGLVGARNVLTFSGYPSATFHPTETTIAVFRA